MLCSNINLGFLLITMATVAHSLDCLPPELVNCTEKSIVAANCTYGVAKDVCGNCWECAHGFGESCGGVWNLGGTCGKGFNCTNNNTEEAVGSQNPGVCCRTVPPRFRQKAAGQLCRQNLHPCSLEIVCLKKLGEECGGEGDLKGICDVDLTCLPLLTEFGEVSENSTCTRIF